MAGLNIQWHKICADVRVRGVWIQNNWAEKVKKFKQLSNLLRKTFRKLCPTLLGGFCWFSVGLQNLIQTSMQVMRFKGLRLTLSSRVMDIWVPGRISVFSLDHPFDRFNSPPFPNNPERINIGWSVEGVFSRPETPPKLPEERSVTVCWCDDEGVIG